MVQAARNKEEWALLCFQGKQSTIISLPTDLFKISPCMSHKTLWVSLSRGWLIHSDSHYSHRGRVNHLPSAKLEASLSPPISFFPTWALSDGLPDCTDTHNWALLRNQGHKSQNNKEKKNYLENNFTDILWTVTFSVPALKGEFNLFSFVHIQFFDFWVESITPPRSFD